MSPESSKLKFQKSSKMVLFASTGPDKICMNGETGGEGNNNLTFELSPFNNGSTHRTKSHDFSQDHWRRWLIEKVGFELGV